MRDNRSPEEIAEVEDVLFRMGRAIDRICGPDKVDASQRARARKALKDYPGASTAQIAKMAKVGKSTVLEAKIDLREKARKSA